MPGKDRYGRTVPLPQGDLVPASVVADTKARLTKLFGTSPILTDEYDMDAVAAETMFSDNVDGDPQLWPDGVDQTFSKSPDIPDEVSDKTGGGGRPSTAYTPNQASPGEGNGTDPAAQPDLKLEPNDIKPGYVPSDNTKNPADTRVRIVNEALTGEFKSSIKFT